jgi:hypothetical protein
MTARFRLLIAVAFLAFTTHLVAQETPAFIYDPARAARYLDQPAAAPAPLPQADPDTLRELSTTVDEILDGPWLPLYSDYSAAQAGGVGPAEWAFVRPGEKFLALAQAAPYMSATQREKCAKQLHDDLASACPTRELFGDFHRGKPRNIRKAPPFKAPTFSAEEKQRRLFTQAYAAWAYASAFDAWEEARPCFADLKTLHAELEKRGDFRPAYQPGHDAILTKALTENPEYRFTVYESLISGYQDNYGYHGARDAKQRMQKGKPVFFYVENLAALIGYYRLAKHFGDVAEQDRAQDNFNRVAFLALSQKSAPYLWCDEYLVPEIAKLLRDHADPWLDQLARTPPIGNLPAVDWDNNLVPNRRDMRVINPHTWYQAWGGQGEGMRPRTVMAAFLVNATLFNAPKARISQTRDIPWCKADLYYLRKLTTELAAPEP